RGLVGRSQPARPSRVRGPTTRARATRPPACPGPESPDPTVESAARLPPIPPQPIQERNVGSCSKPPAWFRRDVGRPSPPCQQLYVVSALRRTHREPFCSRISQ